MKRGNSVVRISLFFVLLNSLISNTLVVAAEPVAQKGLQYTLQKRMAIFKKNMGCMFTKKGCTKEQVAKITALAVSLLFTLGVIGIRLGKKRGPATPLYVQNQRAQSWFNSALRSYSLDDMRHAVLEGLIIGKQELATMKTMAKTKWHIYNVKEVTDFKDDLRELFKNGEDAHQLRPEIKEEFWRWMSVYGY